MWQGDDEKTVLPGAHGERLLRLRRPSEAGFRRARGRLMIGIVVEYACCLVVEAGCQGEGLAVAILRIGLQAPVGGAVVGFVQFDADVMAAQIARGDKGRSGPAE